MNSWKASLVVSGVLACAGPAFAHHSYAMFDRSKDVTLVGTVKEFQWTNPHSFIELLSKAQDGKVKQYSIESGPPSILRRVGWTYASLTPGENVTVVMHPLKSGGDGGALVRVIKANGEQLLDRPAAPSAAAPRSGAQ